jgi:hypothetical protein
MASRPKSRQSGQAAGGSVSARLADSGIPHLTIPVLPPPAAAALVTFDGAMMALQRHRYVDAAKGFRSILDGFPNERGMCDRSQVYLNLCERELRRTSGRPLTLEERVTAATAALNDDEEDRAEELARTVLSEAPDQDLAMYLMAAVHARRGDRSAAMDWLRRAVGVNAELRAQVRHDDDFSSLRELDAFQDLIEVPPAEPARGARRLRHER